MDLLQRFGGAIVGCALGAILTVASLLLVFGIDSETFLLILTAGSLLGAFVGLAFSKFSLHLFEMVIGLFKG